MLVRRPAHAPLRSQRRQQLRGRRLPDRVGRPGGTTSWRAGEHWRFSTSRRAAQYAGIAAYSLPNKREYAERYGYPLLVKSSYDGEEGPDKLGGLACVGWGSAAVAVRRSLFWLGFLIVVGNCCEARSCCADTAARKRADASCN